MSRFVLTEQAEQDLNDIWDYIGDESPEQADAVIAEMRGALELLASAPGIGHRRADVKDPRYRSGEPTASSSPTSATPTPCRSSASSAGIGISGGYSLGP